MIPLVDAHAHGQSPREMRARQNILTMLCATDPREAPAILARRGANLVPCCALHPWKAGNFAAQEMLPFLEQCPVIGEIGLDNVWTDTDMAAQRRAFLWQMQTAQRLQKPIVLHTKGMEREIASLLRDYSIRKLVHWYSCPDFLDLYLAQDCYFTIGPDCDHNPAALSVIRHAPLNRLMTETDGIDAVSWAQNRKVAPEEIGAILIQELRLIAAVKNIPEETARRAVYENFLRFVSGE